MGNSEKEEDRYRAAGNRNDKPVFARRNDEAIPLFINVVATFTKQSLCLFVITFTKQFPKFSLVSAMLKRRRVGELEHKAY